MDTVRFDTMARTFSTRRSRRQTLRILVVSALGLEFPGIIGAENGKHRRHRNRKVNFNQVGCIHVGKRCHGADQYCSGICHGKKGKKRCKAHDTGGCQAGQDICAGNIVTCTSETGGEGTCLRTTGNAGYCGNGTCVACARDAECRGLFGPLAACIVCANCPDGAGCAGPDAL